MNTENEELRERCLNLAADVFRSPGVTAQQLTTIAEHFFQYIKYGPDDGCDCCDEPDGHGPINTGLGMNVLRSCASLEIAEPPDHIHPE